MDALSMVIIWCDVSFENDDSYRSMTDEFQKTTTATPKNSPDSIEIDMAIFNEGKEKLRLNDVPLITVRTADDAIYKIKEHTKKIQKIFIICSGTVGRFLVPEIVRQYSNIHNFYIYTHNIELHLDWANEYPTMIKMFNFHTNLLLRLTRDIGAHFIERGKIFLSTGAPQNALNLFNHARKLEIAANEHDKMQSNSVNGGRNPPPPDFRGHLDMLEGKDGLIAKAEAAVRTQEYPLQSS